jgi:hypothetical protein
MDLSFMRRVMTVDDVGQQAECLLAGLVGGQGAVLPQCQSSGMAVLSILNQVRFDTTGQDAQAELRQFVIEYQIVRFTGAGSINGTLCEFGHVNSELASDRRLTPWKRGGSICRRIRAQRGIVQHDQDEGKSKRFLKLV